MVSRATCTAVSASISTPVWPTFSAVAVQTTSDASGSTSNSTATRVSAIGWHSGIRSLVFLAPMMPASRAMPSTSPFLAEPDWIRAKVAGCMRMRPVATAVRWVLALAPTSTMWAWPWASKWVRGEDVALMGRRKTRVYRNLTTMADDTSRPCLTPKRRLKYPTRFFRWWPRAGTALLVWSLCLGPAWSQRNALPALGEGETMSLAAERQLGDRIARELYRDPDYLEDAVLDDYIAKLWQPLVDSAAARGELSPELRERFAWRILLGKDRSVNAFALPGGYLGVHLGLIAVVTSRDELASVLAHELSHVTQRHIARQMEAQGRMTPWVIGSLILGALAASKNPQATQALVVGGQAAAIQSQLSYSRDMEREADRIGFGVLSEAGYDPRGFVTMFGKLQQAAGLNDSGNFPYLRSHPLTTERIADMHSRLPLGVAISSVPQDMEQAMVSARARVLSQSQVDSLRAWTQLPQSLPPQATPAQQAGSLYAATLAHQMLRENDQARKQWQALQTLTASHTAAARLTRLLGADLQAARGEYAPLVQGMQPSSMVNRWPRRELVAVAQALAHLPGHPATASVVQQLRQQVQNAPYDAQAWNLLGSLLAGQGQKLAALRAEGEAQLVRMDLPGALDRFRAAQDVARQSTLQPGDHIEASIVDTRVRQIQEQIRDMQRER